MQRLLSSTTRVRHASTLGKWVPHAAGTPQRDQHSTGTRILQASVMVAGAALGWIASRGSLADTVKICRKHRLPTPSEAQRTQAVHMEGFLSSEEIDELARAVEEVQDLSLVGEHRRNPAGQADRDGCWRTTFLHTDGVFRERFSRLHDKCRAAFFEVDAANWKILDGYDGAALNFRTVEYHEYEASGRLAAKEHYDAGSLITMDIMLTQPGSDFEGGALVMPEADGSVTTVALRKGDVAFFLSHKYHNVQPVHRGKRKVLVIELWHGAEQTCDHRCR
eukprot:TRINITY_DN45950_c0_g1_i2.p1 TRINITY_DN45950_c0_g1~~TRINITY_DN45950_c0_g1_i2.p1  ORF type:complete len:278 (-),score=49.76 TRINITY_DN45950_c0_g1_i2:376-1209(-)